MSHTIAMQLHTSKTGLFKNLAMLVQRFLHKRVQITFDHLGIHILQKPDNTSAIVDVYLPGDQFDRYYCKCKDAHKLHVCLSTLCFQEFMALVSATDTNTTITINEDLEHVEFMFENAQTGVQSMFKLRNYNIIDGSQPIDDLLQLTIPQHTSILPVPAQILKDICWSMGEANGRDWKMIEVEHSNNKLTFRRERTYEHVTTMTTHSSSDEHRIKTKLSLSLMITFTRYADLANNVDFYISSGDVVTIGYKISDHGHIKIHLCKSVDTLGDVHTFCWRGHLYTA